MIVIYTAIFRESDSPKVASPHARRAVLFTDGAEWDELTRNGWQVALRPRAEDSRRAARILKMTPHELFPEASASVWLDGSIALFDLPRLIADAGGAEIACIPHAYLSTCYEEARAAIRRERANPSGVAEAMEFYRAEGFAPRALSTTGLVYRRHTPAVAAFNRLWREQIERYGVHDQAFVDYCAWKTGVEIRHLRGHYLDNPYMQYDRADHRERRRPRYDNGDRCDYLA